MSSDIALRVSRDAEVNRLTIDSMLTISYNTVTAVGGVVGRIPIVTWDTASSTWITAYIPVYSSN
jgi:hypothetical protein